MKMEPTVFCVDDDPESRKSVTLLLRSVRLPVEVFESAEDFLAAVGPERPGCLVLDVRMPRMSGLDLQQALAERGSTLPIIFLTGYAEVQMAVRAFKAGAFDFMEKPFQDQLLLDTIQAALRLQEKVWAEKHQRDEVTSRLASLTDGERKVLDLMMAGKSYKTIARELDISYKTVQARRGQIMKKMATDDLPGLVHVLLPVHNP